MKLLIAVDMEGITGVSNWEHVTPGSADYSRFRRIMTADVNAAIEGACLAGVEDIVVADGHWNGQNILIEELDPRARLNSGTSAPFSMVQSADSGVNAAFFVGYHARAGTLNAVLDHTWSSVRVMNLWINGRICGETGLNAGVLGHFDAPVIMVSGDQSLAAEACDWIPGVETAVVKTATGRTSAESLSLEEAHNRIRAAAERAVNRMLSGRGPQPLVLGSPVEIAVEFHTTAQADGAALVPGAERKDGRTLVIHANNMAEGYMAFRTLVGMGDRS